MPRHRHANGVSESTLTRLQPAGECGRGQCGDGHASYKCGAGHGATLQADRHAGCKRPAWDRRGPRCWSGNHGGGSVSAATAAETENQLPQVTNAELMVRRTPSASGLQSLGSLGFSLRDSKTSQWQLAWQRLICQANACGNGHE